MVMFVGYEQADAYYCCYTAENPPIRAYLAFGFGLGFFVVNDNFDWCWLWFFLWFLWLWLIPGKLGGFFVVAFVSLELFSLIILIFCNDFIHDFVKLLVIGIHLQRSFDISKCSLVLSQFISRSSSFAQSLCVCGIDVDGCCKLDLRLSPLHHVEGTQPNVEIEVGS